jgi:hypothetical protein
MVRKMSKAFFVSIISALGVLILLNLFGIIGFVVLIIIGGTLIVIPKNERLAVSTKNELLAERVSTDAKHLPVRICVKKQKDNSRVQQI